MTDVLSLQAPEHLTLMLTMRDTLIHGYLSFLTLTF